MTNDLDKLTAERVMGIPKRAVRVMGSATETVDIWTTNPWFRDGGQTAEELRTYGRPPKYSTDPRDTFAVVDKLRAEGWLFSLIDFGNWWRAEFAESVEGRVIGREHKDRLTAIILAANAVKGVSEDEVRAACKEQA